jgi:fucose 4-O-acetylase-like acetyltransferase
MTSAVASAPAAAPPVVPRPKVRVPLWDNARFLSVALVVMGHTLQPQSFDSDLAMTAYLFIYSFHVPVFMLICGFFSKSEPMDAQRIRALILDLVVPYVVVQGIWSVVQLLVEGRLGFNWTTAHWTLWFLLALAAYRILLPYLAQLRFPLVWAIVLSVAVGYWANIDSTLALTRIIGLLPFFVLGWMLKRSTLPDRWIGAPTRAVVAIRAAAAAVIVGWIAVIAANIRFFDAIDLRLWFFYDDSYANLLGGTAPWWAGPVRLGLMALTVLLCAAFLVLVPRRATVFTALGAATMYVYLLHTFVLYPIRQSGFLRGDHATELWVIGAMVFAVLVAFALASKPVRWAFRWLIEPKVPWLFAREPGPPAAGAGSVRAAPDAPPRAPSP